MALTAQTIKGTFSNIGRVITSKAGQKAVQEGAEQTVKEAVKEGTKQAVKKVGSGGVKANMAFGGVAGSLVGGGVGGIAGLATGADEDNTKSMVFMGALAGGAGGAFIGGGAKMVRNIGSKAGQKAAAQAVAQSGAEAAADIATGEANHAVKNGAKGLLEKAGASAQRFADKGVNIVDDIGEGISKKITGRAGAKAEASWTADMLERGYGLADLLDDGTVMGDAMNRSRGKAITEAVEGVTKRANTIGGAAQGAIMGSAGGALVGGVAGGIDEDETFIGGALKGGLIGGTLGGIGGGASGYFNNNARVLANTTANVNSLFK